MSEDDFLNLLCETSGGKVNSEIEPPSDAQILNSGNIIEKKLFSIVTFRIYPNGQMFIVKSQSWFDKAGQIIKKKENKIAEPKKAVLNEEESY